MSAIDRLVREFDSRECEPGGAALIDLEGRLSAALHSIGWRAASDVPAEEVAAELAMIVGAGVRGHRDLGRLRRDVAESLRQHAHHLDGSAAAREDWEPAAAQVIEACARR